MICMNQFVNIIIDYIKHFLKKSQYLELFVLVKKVLEKVYFVDMYAINF